MGNHHVELFQRSEHNPILTAADWPYPVNSVFNPGATLLPDGTTLLLVPRGRSPRTFPFVCRPLRQRCRSLGDRFPADDARPIPNVIRKNYGVSRIRASLTLQN